MSRSSTPGLALRGLSLSTALCLAPALPVLLLAHDAHAVGETNGRVEGIITDAQSGVAVPGATVKIAGKTLIGGPKTTNTDDNGRYDFVELPPGSYDLEVSYEGVKPMRRRFVVRQGETVPLNIKWSVEMANEETVVITEERHMTNPDSNQTGTVLTLDQESKIATARSYQDIVTQVAGVSTEQGSGNPVIKGATLLHNRYLVDGLDITDPVTNTFSANINFDSIASVEVLTGGMEAQYNSLGGVINLITNAGGNDWHIDSSFYINNQHLSLPQQFGPNLYDGTKPFSTLPPGPVQTYKANLNVGGPILKNKLWFNLSFEYDYSETSTPAGPVLNLQIPPESSNRFLIRGKVTYAPSDKHRLTLSASADPAFFNNLNQNNSALAITEDYQSQGGVFSILQWDYFKSKNLNTNIQAGFQWSNIDNGPQGQPGLGLGSGSIDTSGYAGLVPSRFSTVNLKWDPNLSPQTNNVDGTNWYNGGPRQNDTRYTVQFDPSLSLRGRAAGYHDAKFGIQSRYIAHTDAFQYYGGGSYSDINSQGLGQEAGVCNPPVLPNLPPGVTQTRLPAGVGSAAGCNQFTSTANFENKQQGFGIGAYAQDKWKPTSWLLISPGLRVDYGATWNSLGQQVTHLLGFGPRLGFVFDLTRDQKTIFSAFYGRSNETLSLLTAANADASAVSTTQQYNPNTKQWSTLFTSGGANGYRIDTGDYTPPHSDEVTASLRREVFANSVATIDYTYKHMANIWDAIEINQKWDPTGTRVVGYANGQAQQVFYYSTPSQNERTYQGLDFILESQPGKNFDILASYTLAWLYGPGAEQMGQLTGLNFTQFYNPRMYQFYDGFLPEDHRHQIKLRASYSYAGATAGANFGFLSGGNETKQFYNQTDASYTLRRSPQGTEPSAPNDVTAISEFRTPDLITLDLRVQYDFHALIRQHLSLIADIFNVLNLSNANNQGGTGGPRAVTNNDVATFGQIQQRQSPFRAQFGLRYVY